MQALKRRWPLAVGAFAVTALAAWAGAARWQGDTGGRSTPASAPSPAAPRAGRGLPEVSTLHEQTTNAYHARLFADEDSVVLVTERGFTVFQPGMPPVERTLSLGSVAARQGDALVFWRSGWLRSVALAGGDEHELVALPAAPRYLLASEGQLAWIEADRERGTSLKTLSAGEVRVVHTTRDEILAPVLRGAVAYWVSARRDGSWTLERLGVDGQPLVSSAPRRSRPPAMLAAGPDGIYFYEGRERGVRRMAFDLQRETPVLPGVICSPLAVSTRVVCAQVGGLFEISTAGARALASERSGPITATAATPDRAYWVAESGGQGLVVRSAVLPGL